LWDVLKGCASADELRERTLEYFSDMFMNMSKMSPANLRNQDEFVLMEHCYNRRRAYAEALLGVSIPQLSRFEIDG
jgi:hypothetical protein